MREIHFWECEICRLRHPTPEDAARCEARGVPHLDLPCGMIFGDHRPTAFYKDITFAVRRVKQVPQSHFAQASEWACRDNGHGDSLGSEVCGGPTLRLPQVPPDANHNTFIRMVSWLTANGSKYGVERITVWDGKRAVLLGTFLERARGENSQ